MDQYEEIQDMLSESAGNEKELNIMKTFLMSMRQSLRRGKIDLKKLPIEFKQNVKRFNPKKLIQQAGPDKSKILKMQKEYSLITPNPHFSLVLSYITILKSSLTGVSLNVTKNKMAVQYKNSLRKGQTPAIAITTLIVMGLWSLLYYSTQTSVSKIKLPSSIKEKLPSILKGKEIPFSIITTLIIAFVAGLYFMTEHASEPSGSGQIKKSSGEKAVSSKPSIKKPEESGEFIL